MTMSDNAAQPGRGPVDLALQFLSRVWGGAHDLNAIDELMTQDYVITSAGRVVRGREAFKAWVREFHARLHDARTENLEAFSNATGDRVVSRWVCTGRNHGIFSLTPDGREISFTGIAIWAVRDGRLSECWVERSALESYRAHLGEAGFPVSPGTHAPSHVAEMERGEWRGMLTGYSHL